MTGKKARSNDRQTWASFDAALEAYRSGVYNGLGRMCDEHDDVAAVDIDKCIDPLTGAISPDVLADVRRLDSYTERSPSGTGLRVFLRGHVERGRNWRRIRVEVYDRLRYLTMTGHHLEGTPQSVNDRAEVLREICREWDARNRGHGSQPRRSGGFNLHAATDDQLLNQARNAKNGEKFCALFDQGDWPGQGYASQSEADLALCSILAFWTGDDRGRIDRLFRRSALYREKWDRSDYRDATIAKAIEDSAPPRATRKQHEGGERRSTTESRRSSGITTEHLTTIIAERYQSRFAQDAGGKLYLFKDGRYQPRGEDALRKMVKAVLAAERIDWRVERQESAIEYVRVDAPHLWERPPVDTLNVQNGLLDIATRELRPHSPEWLSPLQLPVVFDPTADSPGWDAFIAATFPHDGAELAWEVPAWLMLPDTNIQKAVLLHGDGSNGKSRYLKAVSAFIGGANVTSLSLQKLEQDRFSVARLLGKLGNICPDLPSTQLENTSVFKAITGGDTLVGEYKFRDSFEFTPFARLVFSANELPRSSDGSAAFFRRWIVVPFTARFVDGENAIPTEALDARLASPRELSGVLSRALEVLPRIRKCGLTESESMQQARQEFRQQTDPFAVWLEAATVELPDAFIAKDAMLKAYNDHARGAGRPVMTAHALGRALHQLRPSVMDRQRTVAGRLIWCYIGIGLRSEGEQSHAGHSTQGSGDSRDSRVSALYTRADVPISAKVAVGSSDEEEQDSEHRVNHVNTVGTCPICCGMLTDRGACWQCNIRLCITCGELTGSPFKAECPSCQARECRASG